MWHRLVYRRIPKIRGHLCLTGQISVDNLRYRAACGQNSRLQHHPQWHTHTTPCCWTPCTLYTKMMDGKQMRGEKWWTYRDEEKSRSKSGKYGRGSWPERERCRRHSENDRRVVEMIWSLYQAITHTDIGKTLHWNCEWRVPKRYCRWLTINICEQNRIQL